MKKLIMLVFAFVVTGSVVFAQGNHTASVAQTGSQHESVVEQNAHFGTGHTAEITQQSGDQSYANIRQEQANAEAYVVQTGSKNESRSKQAGYNVLDVLQKGDFNVLGLYGNLSSAAYQKNGSGIFASDANRLDLDQIGNSNRTGVWQEHHGDAEVLQSGKSNEAGVRQSGSPSGALNEVSIAQHGTSNLADGYQQGEGNKATMQQGIGAYYSNNNSAAITQLGDGNEAYSSLEWGGLHEVSISQNGDDNYSEFTVKYGIENAFSEDLEGSFNKTRFIIAPDWGSLNKISVRKLGDSNNIAGYISGDRNIVDVMQEGDTNNVGTSWNTEDGVYIKGGDNNVDVAQMSNSNTSFSTVRGYNNNISVMQN